MASPFRCGFIFSKKNKTKQNQKTDANFLFNWRYVHQISDGTWPKSISMWHHSRVKPQLCPSPGEFKQSSETSDGTHGCDITLRCGILCLNPPWLGQSWGYTPVGCHINVDLVGSHQMFDIHTLFQFTWAQLPNRVSNNNRIMICLPKFALVSIYRRNSRREHECDSWGWLGLQTHD